MTQFPLFEDLIFQAKTMANVARYSPLSTTCFYYPSAYPGSLFQTLTHPLLPPSQSFLPHSSLFQTVRLQIQKPKPCQEKEKRLLQRFRWFRWWWFRWWWWVGAGRRSTARPQWKVRQHLLPSSSFRRWSQQRSGTHQIDFLVQWFSSGRRRWISSLRRRREQSISANRGERSNAAWIAGEWKGPGHQFGGQKNRKVCGTTATRLHGLLWRWAFPQQWQQQSGNQYNISTVQQQQWGNQRTRGRRFRRNMSNIHTNGRRETIGGEIQHDTHGTWFTSLHWCKQFKHECVSIVVGSTTQTNWSEWHVVGGGGFEKSIVDAKTVLRGKKGCAIGVVHLGKKSGECYYLYMNGKEDGKERRPTE